MCFIMDSLSSESPKSPSNFYIPSVHSFSALIFALISLSFFLSFCLSIYSSFVSRIQLGSTDRFFSNPSPSDHRFNKTDSFNSWTLTVRVLHLFQISRPPFIKENTYVFPPSAVSNSEETKNTNWNWILLLSE